MSKTEEAMVTSEKRVSGQRQSPGKGWPQPEVGELGNSQEIRASGTEETRGKKRRQLGSLTRRQEDKGLLVHARPLVGTPYALFRSLPVTVALQRYPLPSSVPSVK